MRYDRYGLFILIASLLAVASMAGAADVPVVKERITAYIQEMKDAADSRNPYESLVPPGTELIDVTANQAGVAVTFNRTLGWRQ
jgi:hypothetical protein